MSTQTADAAIEPQLIPLNAVFADDFLELLVPVMSNMTMTQVAAAVAAHVEGIRVQPRDAVKAVYFRGVELDATATVAAAGIPPMAHIRVDYKD